MSKSIGVATITAVSLVLTACDAQDVEELMGAGSSKNVPKIERTFSAEQLARGAMLFKNNCASCHGDQGQGSTNWQKRDKDGKLPPPPLDGTGHTWHHPTRVLKYTIMNGTGKIGGNMPAFKGKLSDADMDDILAFIQNKWPQPLYEAWYKTDQRAKEKKKP